MLIGAFSWVANSGESNGQVDTTKMHNTLVSLFEQAAMGLNATLERAVGRGDQDFDSLPNRGKTVGTALFLLRVHC